MGSQGKRKTPMLQNINLRQNQRNLSPSLQRVSLEALRVLSNWPCASRLRSRHCSDRCWGQFRELRDLVAALGTTRVFLGAKYQRD
jgi:hypothetical protein